MMCRRRHQRQVTEGLGDGERTDHTEQSGAPAFERSRGEHCADGCAHQHHDDESAANRYDSARGGVRSDRDHRGAPPDQSAAHPARPRLRRTHAPHLTAAATTPPSRPGDRSTSTVRRSHHLYGETVSDSYRTLLLLRHAKSDYPPGVADHARPLAPRGIREAELAGDWLRAHVPAVDAVLCSTATRTRQTLERTRIDAPVAFVDRLYEATPGDVIDEINRVPTRFASDVATLLVIGHEPTMSALALGLATDEGSNGAAAERILAKFPTSAIAVLRTSESWSQLAPDGAALVTFHVPR